MRILGLTWNRNFDSDSIGDNFMEFIKLPISTVDRTLEESISGLLERLEKKRKVKQESDWEAVLRILSRIKRRY